MAPFVARWGIIGCGGISGTFVRDIALERPDVTDVAHAVVAVGSRDKTRAEAWLKKNIPDGANAQKAGLAPPAVAYSSYAEVFANPDVKIVYVGTLHATHYNDCKAALEAGKHVVVEKPAVLNATEWADLCRIAKANKLFLMEALWTRFQPAVRELYKRLHVDKVIGDIRQVTSAFNVPNYNAVPDDHRLLALSAAGGPLLDVGAYCMVPARIALQDSPANGGARPVVSTSMLRSRVGTDLATTLVLDYPALDARAVCNMNFNCRSPHLASVSIIGTTGEVTLRGSLERITSFTIHRLTKDGRATREPDVWEDEVVKREITGHGLNLEADAAARAIRDGLLEEPTVPHSETQLTMEIFDQARREGGYVLPEGMEQLGRVV